MNFNNNGNQSHNITNFIRNRVSRFGRFGLSKKYQQALITPLSDEQRKVVIEKLRKKGLQPTPEWSKVNNLTNDVGKRTDELDRKKVTFERKNRDNLSFDPSSRIVEELLSSAPSSPSMSDRNVPSTTHNRPRTLRIDIPDTGIISDVSLSAPSSPSNDGATYYDTIPLLPECRDINNDFFHPSNIPFKSYFPFVAPSNTIESNNSSSINIMSNDNNNNNNINGNSTQIGTMYPDNTRFVIGSEEPQLLDSLPITSDKSIFPIKLPLPPLPGPSYDPVQSLIHNELTYPNVTNRVRGSKMQTLNQLMEKLQIKHLSPTFKSHGIETLNSFTKINEKLLDKMEIHSTELRTKILTAIELLSDDEDAALRDMKQYKSDISKNVMDKTEKSSRSLSTETSMSETRRRRTYSVSRGSRESKYVGAGYISSTNKRHTSNTSSSHHSPHRSHSSGTGTAVKKSSHHTSVGSASMSGTTSKRLHSSHGSKQQQLTGGSSIAAGSTKNPATSSQQIVSVQSNNNNNNNNSNAFATTHHPSYYPPFSLLDCKEPMIIHQHIHHHHHMASTSALPPVSSSSIAVANIPSAATIKSVDGLNQTLPQLAWRNNELTKNIVDKKLNSESIKLTEYPYSDTTGNSGIPLRLIERYAYDLEKDIRDVAMAMETIRTDSLLNNGRNVMSNMPAILSDQFLNCDGIKTDSLETFLVSIGLPMYCRTVPHQCRNLQTLLLYSDEALTSKFNIRPDHIRWIRREASFLPIGFLHPSSSYLHHSRYNSGGSGGGGGGSGRFFAADRV